MLFHAPQRVLASETSQAYSKHYQDFYKEASKSGFNKNEMKKLSSEHLGAAQKNSAAVHKREFNRMSKEAYKNYKPSPKGEGSVGKSPTAAAPPKPKSRGGVGPTTGDMSAGATKGAEKVQFGKPAQ